MGKSRDFMVFHVQMFKQTFVILRDDFPQPHWGKVLKRSVKFCCKDMRYDHPTMNGIPYDDHDRGTCSHFVPAEPSFSSCLVRLRPLARHHQSSPTLPYCLELFFVVLLFNVVTKPNKKQKLSSIYSTS